MKIRLIVDNKDLNCKLSELFNDHRSFSSATAWASNGPKLVMNMKKHPEKIAKVIIGTHFYQTDPNFVENYVGSKNVLFMLSSDGVFHPKIFAFESSNSWAVVIGSANLTNGAMTKNDEVMALVQGKDTDDEFFVDAQNLIETYWEGAKSISAEEAQLYRLMWQRNRKARDKLSGKYSESKKSKSPLLSSFLTMSWEQFYMRMQTDPHHGFEERLKLLQVVQGHFRAVSSFKDIPTEVRKMIAGMPNNYNEKWGWFGSMKPRGEFKKIIISNNQNVSNALDIIPMDGMVSRYIYLKFVTEFQKAFPNAQEKSGATRLLCMKRPDLFITFNAMNSEALCQNFGINKRNMGYEKYWDEIIVRVQDSNWWNAEPPANSKEKLAWNFRAAMLDSITYQP